jgi:glycosyltransferase involved in cell wall biosynthesis
VKYLVSVDDCFIDLPGGSGRVAWDVARLMRDLGHEVTMFCIRRLAHSPGESTVDGIRILRYDKRQLSPWDPRRAQANIAAAESAARQRLCAERWDVVHMHSIYTSTGVMRGLGSGPRYVYTMHGPMVLEQQVNWRSQGWPGRLKLAFGQRRVNRLEYELLRRSHDIQTLSRFTRSKVEELHQLGHRVTVIPHWHQPAYRRTKSKIEARRLLGWHESDVTFFTLRTHGPRYGLDIAIDALSPLLKAKRCRFVVAGDGPMRSALEQQAARLGVTERVTFTGRLTDEQVALAYQASDLFVLPTLALECFGLIILEAFAYGCPVLSSDAGAIPETMQPIMPQFIVPAGDVEALRNKASAFLDGHLVPPSSDALIEYVGERFAYSVVTPRLSALLEGRRS